MLNYADFLKNDVNYESSEMTHKLFAFIVLVMETSSRKQFLLFSSLLLISFKHPQIVINYLDMRSVIVPFVRSCSLFTVVCKSSGAGALNPFNHLFKVRNIIYLKCGTSMLTHPYSDVRASAQILRKSS